LGLDPAQLRQKPLISHVCSFDDKGRDNTNNQICGRRVALARCVDGIDFYGSDPTEGFSIEFGSHGKTRSFSIVWPDLKRDEKCQIATPQQIITCIRAHKTPVIPNGDEGSPYFARINALANAKKFTITKITPYYDEGVLGEVPTNNEPSKLVAPFAELEAVADFGNSNLTIRLFSPVLSSEATRMLATKTK